MPRGRPRKRGRKVLLQSAELIGWALGGLEREIVETKKRLATLTASVTLPRSRPSRSALPSSAATLNP